MGLRRGEMRLLQLLMLALLATAASADTFNITFDPYIDLLLYGNVPREPIFATGYIIQGWNLHRLRD